MQSLSISPCCKSNCHTKVQDCHRKYKTNEVVKWRQASWWNWPVPRTCPFPSYSPPRVPSPSSRTSSHSPWLRSCAWPRIRSSTCAKKTGVQKITWSIFHLARWSRRRLLVKRNICSQMWHLFMKIDCTLGHIDLRSFQKLFRKSKTFKTCGRQTWPLLAPHDFFYSRPSQLHASSDVATWMLHDDNVKFQIPMILSKLEMSIFSSPC